MLRICSAPVLCAYIPQMSVVRAGAQMTLASLLDFLKGEHMSVWQMPERLELMDELPKTAGGKIMTNKLRELVAAKVAGEVPAAETASGAAA